jgi:uncharacterized protein YjbI with pentapeptide repeats
MIRFSRFAWVSIVVWISPAQSADFSAAQVRAIIAVATADKPADLSGKSLENLDLSNLDFRRANLSGANLFGTKLDSADLSGANLSGAKLDLSWIMRANFTSADLSNASLLGLVVSSGLDISLAEAPIFKGAKFSGARIIARLSRFDLMNVAFQETTGEPFSLPFGGSTDTHQLVRALTKAELFDQCEKCHEIDRINAILDAEQRV